MPREALPCGASRSQAITCDRATVDACPFKKSEKGSGSRPAGLVRRGHSPGRGTTALCTGLHKMHNALPLMHTRKSLSHNDLCRQKAPKTAPQKNDLHMHNALSRPPPSTPHAPPATPSPFRSCRLYRLA